MLSNADSLDFTVFEAIEDAVFDHLVVFVVLTFRYVIMLYSSSIILRS